MNLDRLCYCFVLSLLPLLWLPFEWLAYSFVLCGLSLGLAIWRRSGLWLLLAVLQAVSFGQIFATAHKANSVKAARVQEPITIRQILKQGEFQAVIAERATGERIYLTSQSKTPLQLSAHYQGDFSVRPISSRLNEGNFDRQKWYFAQHIEQIGTLRNAQLLSQEDLPLRTRWLDRVRQQTDELPSQGLLLALGFGERAWLDPQHWQHFQQTSTAHLIAISGLHIALAMGFGVLLGKGIQWLLWHLPRLPPQLQAVAFSPFFTKIIGIAFAAGYSYLAGFAIPTLRALWVIGLLLLCQLARRHYTAWQFWWRAVALLLLFEPISLLSDSFWLSVLAVASLIIWYQFFPLKAFLPENCKKWQKTARLFISLVHLQIGIWLVFSPVQLAFFDGISPFALLANLLIVPLYSFLLVPLILFSLLTDNLLNSWQLADWLVQGSLSLLEPMADYWIDLSTAEQWHLLSFNLLILLLLYCWRIRSKKVLWLCLFPLLFDRLFALPTWFFPPPTVQWINFDVGQGLAMALVYTENGERKALLYDTGSSWSGGSMAKLEILPYLKRQGIDLTAIFVSHSDNDHSGGVEDLLHAFPQAKIMSSDHNNYGSPHHEPCVAGRKWQFGEIRLQAIFPETVVKQAENQHSCVLKVEIGRYRLLFTGDSGSKQEQLFAHKIGKIDFLQVGHHGSNSSTSHTLLANVQPNVAVISAGRWNPWRLPNKQVEKRLNQYNVTLFNTAQTGMVRVDFYPENYKIWQKRDRLSPWYQGYFGER